MNKIREHQLETSGVQVKWQSFQRLSDTHSAARNDNCAGPLVGGHIIVLHIGHDEYMVARGILVHVTAFVALTTHMGKILPFIYQRLVDTFP